MKKKEISVTLVNCDGLSGAERSEVRSVITKQLHWKNFPGGTLKFTLDRRVKTRGAQPGLSLVSSEEQAVILKIVSQCSPNRGIVGYLMWESSSREVGSERPSLSTYLDARPTSAAASRRKRRKKSKARQRNKHQCPESDPFLARQATPMSDLLPDEEVQALLAAPRRNVLLTALREMIEVEQQKQCEAAPYVSLKSLLFRVNYVKGSSPAFTQDEVVTLLVQPVQDGSVLWYGWKKGGSYFSLPAAGTSKVVQIKQA